MFEFLCLCFFSLFARKRGGLAWVIGVWVWCLDIGVGQWISASGFFFFWVIGDRCGVWVIGVWYLMVIFFFFFFGIDGGL